MSRDGGVNERIYMQIRAELLDGSMSAHARIDFAELAEQFQVSTTPVRESVMRLLGEGLLEIHPKGGIRPAFVSEFTLRALLDLHGRLATLAHDWGTQELEAATAATSELPAHERTRRFFLALARTTGNMEFTTIIGRLSDRLTPFRRLEERLISDIDSELSALQASVGSSLARRLLKSYHRRRQAMVAQLVWMSASQAEHDR